MKICELTTDKIPDWDKFVLQSDSASVYHLSGWKELIERTFHHETFYLYAEDKTEIAGILPMVFINSTIFGKSLVSMPFFNYGGVLANHENTRNKLLEAAIDIAKDKKIDQLELRHEDPFTLNLIQNKSKVSMILNLPESPEDLWSGFSSKLRNRTRKPMKNGFEARFGGKEMVKDFYNIFSENMRDLGSPVYSIKFFVNIIDQFPDLAKICVVYLGKQPTSAGFLIRFKEKLEIPWASSIRKYNRSCPNMLLYWKILEYACSKGFKRFDFGRSTPKEGTYKFKEQWGAKPKQLYWDYWSDDPDKIRFINQPSTKLIKMIAVWKTLPVGLTKIIGPMVRKNISA